MSKIYKKFVDIVSSKKFFWVILGFFIFESMWFALSSKYPMAFDEKYHFTTIQIYSHKISPFFLKQPSGPLTYGPLIHNTSFLYHYLLSFPYRLLTYLSLSFVIKIIILRFINIALFIWALMIFRRILLKVKDEPAVANLSILFFILIPIVPFLAGQINYDNLGILLTAITILWTIRFTEQLRTKHQLNIRLLINTMSISLFLSVVSYLFLPFLAAINLYLAYVIFKQYAVKSKQFKKAAKYDYHQIKITSKIVYLIIFIISTGLFSQSYAENIIKYHNPVAQCNQVLSIKQCSSYAPWFRNYQDSQLHIKIDENPLRYTISWIYNMFERIVFTINGPDGKESYANPTPLPVMSITFAVIFTGGFILLIKYGKLLMKNRPYLKLILFIDIIFLSSLWGRNYHDFIHLGQQIAINGRYLIPIMLPIIFIFGLAYKELFKNNKTLSAYLSVILLVCLLQGGGVISFIYYSDINWYWSNKNIIQINQDTKKLIMPYIFN